MRKTVLVTASLFTLCFAAVASAQVASGGSYTIEQSVVANGGGSSVGGTYGVEGTIGQSIAGTQSTAGSYLDHGGFWQAFFASTAAHVPVSGRVTASDGTGIAGVRLTLFDLAGNVYQCVSSPFGYFQFDGIEVGRTYLLSATSKRYQFATRPLNIEDSIADLIIVANP